MVILTVDYAVRFSGGLPLGASLGVLLRRAALLHLSIGDDLQAGARAARLAASSSVDTATAGASTRAPVRIGNSCVSGGGDAANWSQGGFVA